MQGKGRLLLTKIDKEQLGAVDRLARIEVELVQHVEDAVGTKRDTYTAHTAQTEYAGQVIVATAASDAANLYVECFDLEDGAGIVVQTAGQSQIQLNLVFQLHRLEGVQNECALLHALQACFTCSQHLLQCSQFLIVAATQQNDGLQFGNRFVAYSFVAQFGVNMLQTNLVQFIDSHGDIHNLLRLANDFSDASQNLAVIDFDADPDAEA